MNKNAIEDSVGSSANGFAKPVLEVVISVPVAPAPAVGEDADPEPGEGGVGAGVPVSTLPAGGVARDQVMV